MRPEDNGVHKVKINQITCYDFQVVLEANTHILYFQVLREKFGINFTFGSNSLFYFSAQSTCWMISQSDAKHYAFILSVTQNV